MKRASRRGKSKQPAPSRPSRSLRLREARWQRERRWRRIVLALGAFVIAVVIAIPAIGLANETFRVPFHKPALRVGGTLFDWGYFLKYYRATQPPLSSIDGMRQGMSQLLDDELIRQESSGRGLGATTDELREQMKRSLQATSDEDLEVRLRSHLRETGLSLKEYEDITRAAVLRAKLREDLAKDLPAQADQVHVAAIYLLASLQEVDTVGKKLAEGQDFAAVALEHSKDEASKANGGDLGWFPKDLLDLEAIEMVHVRQIALSSLEAAQAARDRVDRGEDFAALAQELSVDRVTGEKGGDLGWTVLAALQRPAVEAVAALAPGGVTAPIAVDQGAVLVKLEERSPSGQAIDDIAFGMEVGAVTPPLLTARGYYFIKLLERAEGRPLEGAALAQLKNRALGEWLAQTAEGRYQLYDQSTAEIQSQFDWMKKKLGG